MALKLTDNDFFKLRDYMYNRFGINLAQKRMLIEGRLGLTVEQRGYDSFKSYIEALMADTSGELVSMLVSKLTTNFTYFMREENHFDFMRSTALPKILPTIKDKSLNIWSAGCSSGEEPYSIAMSLDDYFKGNKQGFDTKVLATDISNNVLGMAKEGVYPRDRIGKMNPAWVKKYFTEEPGDMFRVKDSIKNEVIFRNFNLMEPAFIFKRKFHIIFCRNVMIYFDAPTRDALAAKFYDALYPGGYMFIGMSETLLNRSTKFAYVKPSMYTKA